jgi:hypothetical protein
MQVRAELCHVDTLRCIVRAEAWSGEGCIASCLGEAANAEDAEDRARQRLQQKLAGGDAKPQVAPETKTAPTPPQARMAESRPQPAPIKQPEAIAKQVAVDQPPAAETPQHPSPASNPPSETPTDPEDWSEELTAIDLELKRIGWGRDQERVYLERAFGHASRHRLTRYADLVAYLRQLRQLQPQEQPDQAHIPIRRSDLITQGDQMLKQLGWKAEQARGFLQEHLQASSRQQLTDEQLLQFNMLLEEQAIAKS